MYKKIVITAGGIALILFGFLLLTIQLEEPVGSNDGIESLILLLASFIIGIVGLLSQTSSGRIGRAGLCLSLIGLALMSGLFLFGDVLPIPDLPDSVFIMTLLTIPAGLVIYGLTALRDRPLRLGNALPLAAAALLMIIFYQNPTWPVWILVTSGLLAGLAWIGLGYVLILSRPGREGGSAVAPPISRAALMGGGALLVSVVALQAYILQVNASHDTCPAPIAALPRLPDSPRPVIVDIDAAHEDMNATTYLLQHPDIDVKAVTVVGTGEAHCEAGMRNTRSLLALHGRPDIPVACGSETPLVGSQEFPAEWRADADNLYGVRLPENTTPATSLTAPELITEIINASEEQVSLVAVGPLTNLGQALDADASLANGIESIFIMGGAVEIGGNVGMSGVGIDNPVAEWNIFIDPRAANIVFASGAPITLVPLNATRHAPATTDFFRCIQENHETPEAKFVYDILRANYEFVESGGFQFWDTLTAAILTDESLAEFEMLDLIAVEEAGLSLGQTRPDKNGHPVRVARSADGERFEAMLLQVLNEGN